RRVSHFGRSLSRAPSPPDRTPGSPGVVRAGPEPAGCVRPHRAAQCTRLPADLESVGRRTAFAEVLDRKLQAIDAPLPRVSAQYGHRATVHTFYEFAAATKPVTRWHPRHPYATRAAADGLPRPEAAGRKRRLS